MGVVTGLEATPELGHLGVSPDFIPAGSKSGEGWEVFMVLNWEKDEGRVDFSF